MDIIAPTVNGELKKLHDSLAAQHLALSNRLGTVTSIDEATAILREMQEINFRVIISGSLLFKATSESIDARLESVVAAAADLDIAIREFDKINNLIKDISKYLGLVDKILDLVKLA